MAGNLLRMRYVIGVDKKHHYTPYLPDKFEHHEY